MQHSLSIILETRSCCAVYAVYAVPAVPAVPKVHLYMKVGCHRRRHPFPVTITDDTMKFSSALFLLPALTIARPASLLWRQVDLEAITDTLLFSDSMAQFQAARNAHDPPELDFSSDGCSDSPDNPLGFDFLQSCQRHDFGYRNYKAQGRFDDAGKARIDNNFKSDMYNQCATEGDLEDVCDGVADLYYEAVVLFGSKMKERSEMQA